MIKVLEYDIHLIVPSFHDKIQFIKTAKHLMVIKQEM